jgi:uncharacterized membrane protein (DUF2068 family)
MKKNAWTTIAAILLILYALTNFGAGIGQFSKAKAVSGSASFAASMGKMAGDNVRARQIQRQGTSESAVLYVIAIFILATAVLELVGAVGLFSEQSWAVALVTVAAICGVLVEIQDIAEDGFGVGKLIFLAINALALFVAQSTKLPVEQPQAAQ